MRITYFETFILNFQMVDERNGYYVEILNENGEKVCKYMNVEKFIKEIKAPDSGVIFNPNKKL